MVELVQQLEPACQQAGHVFVASVSRLLERLLGTSMNLTVGIPPTRLSREFPPKNWDRWKATFRYPVSPPPMLWNRIRMDPH